MKQDGMNKKKSVEKQEPSFKGPAPKVRKVNGFLVFIDDVLGVGQYGKVVKAQLESEARQKIKKIYACKIIEIVNISQDDMECIEKEVRLHNLV